MLYYAKHQHEPGPGECRPQPTLQARREEAKIAKSARAKKGCRTSASGPARRKATQRVNDRMKLHFSHIMLLHIGVTSLQYTLINCCKCIRSINVTYLGSVHLDLPSFPWTHPFSIETCQWKDQYASLKGGFHTFHTVDESNSALPGMHKAM